MDAWLERRMTEIQLAAQTEIVQSTDPKRITPFLHQIKEQSDVYEDVVFANANGIAIANTNEAAVGINISERDYFKNGVQGEANYSDVIISKGTEERVIIVASPVKEDSGNIAGVMFASVNFEAFIDTLLQDEDTHVTGVGTMLVDSQNCLQATPVEENIGKTVEEAELGEAVANIVLRDSK